MKKKFKVPTNVIRLIKRIRADGHKAYIVGGVIRDMFLGRDLGDFDIATDATPHEITSIFKKTVPTGIKHGTVTVIEKGEPFEITTFRSDGAYTDSRHPDRVKFISSLEEDLARRDFTVNAIAYDPIDSVIGDPYGGVRDLRRKLLKTVGPPKDRFKEDALRIIRAARFAATLQFKIEKKTLEAMKKLAKRVKTLSKERVRDELVKTLRSKKPSVGFNILLKTGILFIIIPELKKAVHFDQGGFHEYDLFTHTLLAVDNVGPQFPLLRLAALFHDIGKIRTRVIEGKDYRFYGHENVSARIAERIMKRLKFSNRETEYVSALIRNHMFNYNDEWKDGALRRLLARVGTEKIEDLLMLRDADARACGKNRKPWKEISFMKRRIDEIRKRDLSIKLSDLKVDGHDVMKILKIAPGKRVGEILRKLLTEVIDDESMNRGPVLREMIKKLGKGRN